MSSQPPKPPTNYRALSQTTTRNLIIGFFVILFVIGLGLIGMFYGWGGVAGALVCLLSALGLIGVLALIMGGLEKLSQWLDNR